ncbi:sigma-E processing peptidase SpoIIGA [Baia soyae]|uniref:Sporulation sigma-E factor-processing peptidase n=1 Tax=Baia soyae TaxID=1544746 RepID=A0A4V2SYH7_9BACL|nr:sigma-E processing peptidase SpoIIGA [Baia soyae]TCP70421.1 sporulation factor SpoIIGA [Baia soyae]
MTVYADVVFLLNGCIDLLLLWLTSGIRKQRFTWWRLWCAAIMGGVYATLQLWPDFIPAYSLPAKLLVSLLMIWCAFGYHHPYAYLRNLGVFYLVCFVTGGAMMALHYFITGTSDIGGGILFTESPNGWGSPVSWVFLMIGFPLVWGYTKISFGSIQERSEFHQFLVPVRITLDGIKVDCTGLVDTGNQLRDPITRSPVMMVEMEQLQDFLPQEVFSMVRAKDWEKGWTEIPPEWMIKIRIIPYRVAGSDHEMMIAFKPDSVEIWKEDEWNNVGKVLIGIDVGRISSDGTYQAIIHPSCYSVVS